jgi:hypothetical protein
MRRLTSAPLLCLATLIAVLAARADDGFAPPERFNAEQRDHWAYQPVVRPDPPELRDDAWSRNAIDRFLLQAYREMEFEHAPEADRVSLLRRVTFDLTGLPPTVDEVAAFLADTRPGAYERLVDRLLASPAYGQKWAQHWLDLAHYADTNGFELDAERPDAWRYRDWVVNALNADMPYDRFLTLQIAGDEAEPGNVDALIATGFARSGPREVVGGNIDPAVKRQSELSEVTGTVGSVVLGLTMACARCHDHKFDALPTTDYYRLQSFFAGANLVDVLIDTKEHVEAFEAAKKEVARKTQPLKVAQAKLERPYRDALHARKKAALSAEENAVLAVPDEKRTELQKKMAAGANKALNITWEEVAAAVKADPDPAVHAERERLKLAIHEIEVTLPRPPAHAMALIDEKPEAPETIVLRRGDVKSPGPKVAPRPPGVLLASMPEGSFEAAFTPTEKTPGRRLALARWLTRPDHPLTARVIVNRLWHHHFGRGLVATPSDFGVRGEAPSHPELLYWLAAELMAEGWRLKPIHRLMVMSAAYRQSSTYKNAQQHIDDPDNTLLWRMNRRRVDAEGLRDGLLVLSGELNPEAGGPGVRVPIEKEIEDLIFTEQEEVDLWPETTDPAQKARRSLYLYRKRNVRYPMFDAFDAPDTQTACPVRQASTHALQSLVMVNSAFTIDRVRALAGRVLASAPDDASRLDLLYRIVLARSPRDEERRLAAAFLDDQAAYLAPRESSGPPLSRPEPMPAEGVGPARAAAWVDLAMAMVNRNEFLYVP